ncbi:hypothetical protein FQN50_006975 [Emmonsiellopsis sp. PD_5]|nr:hypothetical protein FQN50_006975 [Emmonsiellopsis sp. PD_5]
MAHNQPATGGEYDRQTGIICNELCYGCSMERFAVALRGGICILTMGISEILRGQDGWCAPCLQHPTVPPPHRTRSQVTYVTQQPSQHPPMGQTIPMTTTTVMHPAPAQGGVSQHPGRTPSHGYIPPPPDFVNSTYAQSQPNAQLHSQQQAFSEFQQQPLPQIQPEALSSQAYPGYEEQVPQHVPEQMYEYEQQQQMDLEQQNQQQAHTEFQEQPFVQQQQEYAGLQQQPLVQQQQAYVELQQQPLVQQQQQQQQWPQQYPQQPPHRINSPVYQHPVALSPGTTNPGSPGSPIPQASMMITPPASQNSTPPRKPLNIIYAPHTTYTPPPQQPQPQPQQVYIQPVIQVKPKPKLKRKDSSSSDSS